MDATSADQGRRDLAVAICARDLSAGDHIRLAGWHVDHATPVPVDVLVTAAGLVYGAGDLRLALRLAQAAVTSAGESSSPHGL